MSTWQCGSCAAEAQGTGGGWPPSGWEVTLPSGAPAPKDEGDTPQARGARVICGECRKVGVAGDWRVEIARGYVWLVRGLSTSHELSPDEARALAALLLRAAERAR